MARLGPRSRRGTECGLLNDKRFSRPIIEGTVKTRLGRPRRPAIDPPNQH